MPFLFISSSDEDTDISLKCTPSLSDTEAIEESSTDITKDKQHVNNNY